LLPKAFGPGDFGPSRDWPASKKSLRDCVGRHIAARNQR
jgi:hypothetical protein